VCIHHDGDTENVAVVCEESELAKGPEILVLIDLTGLLSPSRSAKRLPLSHTSGSDWTSLLWITAASWSSPAVTQSVA